MKHFFSFLIFWGVFQKTDAQSVIFDSHIGYTVGEREHSKNIMLYRASGILYEREIKYATSFITGFYAGSAQFSYTDTSKKNTFEKDYIIHVSTLFSKNNSISKNTSLYLQLGPVFSLLPITKKEIFSENAKEVLKIKSLGFNTGLMLNLGFKTMLAKNNWYFAFAIVGYQDFFATNKKGGEKIKFNQFGLSFSFIKTFD